MSRTVASRTRAAVFLLRLLTIASTSSQTCRTAITSTAPAGRGGGGRCWGGRTGGAARRGRLLGWRLVRAWGRSARRLLSGRLGGRWPVYRRLVGRRGGARWRLLRGRRLVRRCLRDARRRGRLSSLRLVRVGGALRYHWKILIWGEAGSGE